MAIAKKLKENNLHLIEKARKVKLVLTDNDGVLTDTGVYYSDKGEELKRFSIRDGMGVERLRNILGIETGIITGELSGSVKKRAEKLKITELFLGAKEKHKLLEEIVKRNKIKPENIGYIGDDVNDIEMMKLVGFTASPGDAMIDVRSIVDYVCEQKGGNGAFREFAELIIALNEE
ncbi:MAG TPA: HAD-IIIA family hydrolase [Ignavibacteriaceae bacterium]|nr:HAD-IIIA family hydrolase [Ignavibacteriaceae bacterium]